MRVTSDLPQLVFLICEMAVVLFQLLLDFLKLGFEGCELGGSGVLSRGSGMMVRKSSIRMGRHVVSW